MIIAHGNQIEGHMEIKQSKKLDDQIIVGHMEIKQNNKLDDRIVGHMIRLTKYLIKTENWKKIIIQIEGLHGHPPEESVK